MGLQMPCGQCQREGRARLLGGPRGRRRHRSLSEDRDHRQRHRTERTHRARRVEDSPGAGVHPPRRPTLCAPRQGRQEPSATVLPGRVGPRGRIRPVDPHVDQGDAHGGTGSRDHGRDRGPHGVDHSGKRRIQGRAAGKRWNEADFQHCKSRRAGKRFGNGTANPAGPALRELHPQHCKCRTSSTANLAGLYI